MLCHRYIADRLKDLWNLSQIGANLKTQWHFKISIEKYKTGLVDIVYFEKNLVLQIVYLRRSMGCLLVTEVEASEEGFLATLSDLVIYL